MKGTHLGPVASLSIYSIAADVPFLGLIELTSFQVDSIRPNPKRRESSLYRQPRSSLTLPSPCFAVAGP